MIAGKIIKLFAYMQRQCSERGMQWFSLTAVPTLHRLHTVVSLKDEDCTPAVKSSSYLAQQLRETQHLPDEHAQANQDGVELADGTSDMSWGNFSQIHGQDTESDAWQRENNGKKIFDYTYI